MKKLFFAALVAVAAVGGALSTQAGTIYSGDDSLTYNCNASVAPLCTPSDFPTGVKIRPIDSEGLYQAPQDVLTENDFKNF